MISKEDEVTLNARFPEGEAGAQMLARMNQRHRGLTEWGFSQIKWNKRDDVLDVGCGGGMAINLASESVTEGHLFGIDLSPLSIATAKKTNEELVAAGRMSFEVASVDELPFKDRSMDKVISIESFYFWPDPDRALHEIARVLKEGGKLMIALEYRSDAEPSESFERARELMEMNVPDASSLTQAYQRAGFIHVKSYIKGPWLCVVGEK